MRAGSLLPDIVQAVELERVVVDDGAELDAYDRGRRLTGMMRYANVSSTTLVYAYDLAGRITQKVENVVTTN